MKSFSSGENHSTRAKFQRHCTHFDTHQEACAGFWPITGQGGGYIWPYPGGEGSAHLAFAGAKRDETKQMNENIMWP